ncbi:hypothetical protein [Micromonospora sp. DT229]|uniref:hypothetical protein n=1 Tax=Micromonospora sp. DT229 TaxID=3393430 RepID=UPI003CF520E6
MTCGRVHCAVGRPALRQKLYVGCWGHTIQVGFAREPVATVTAESTVWSEILFGGLPLADAERAGDVHITGDRDAVGRVVGLYLTGQRPTNGYGNLASRPG